MLTRLHEAITRGDAAATEAAVAALLAQQPPDKALLEQVYAALRRAGWSEAADSVVRRLVAIDPHDIRAVTQLAMMLIAAGDHAQAEGHARNLIRLAPDRAQSHRLLGTILTATRRPAAGAHHFRQALKLGGVNAADLEQLAWSLLQQGRLQEARAIYEKAAALAPASVSILHGQAWVEVVDGKPGAALPIIVRARALAPPGDVDLCCLHAAALERERQPEAALALLQNLHHTKLSLAHRGRLLDRIGQYDQAFADFAEAKRLACAEKGPYRRAEAQGMAQQLRAFFTRDRVATLRRAGRRADMPQPIFILGFPRSGTTLVEQTLSMNARIAAGDELPCVGEVIRRLPRLIGSDLSYPPALADLWMGDRLDDLDVVRDEYLRQCRAAGIFRDGIVWFTDKMPLNEMHLGLLGLLFPHSPLIHLIRHPLDVVLSVYSQHMTHGYECDTALETIAHHYVLVADLVAHYLGQMELRYLAIRYEDMVQQQEVSVRRLMDFIGEKFDPAMLRFETNPRPARSASAAQVAEKLHTRSLFRHRHYLRHLQPVIPILQPIIARLGYTSPAPSTALSPSALRLPGSGTSTRHGRA